MALLTIVGVGASAGGLDPLRRLLSSLPPRPGFAVVVVQHLDPRHESALPELLAKSTVLPVYEVLDGMAWEHDQIYVMPPNVTIAVGDGHLRLTRREPHVGAPHPIDDFFQSMADDRTVRGMGVVLSGAGSDGARGLRALKEAGGVTFAQDPASASFNGMPGSAIDYGGVDFVDTPEDIARKMVEIAGHRDWHPKPTSGAVPAGAALREVLTVLHAATGVAFDAYKEGTVTRRVMRRVVLRRADSLQHYARILREDPSEAQALYKDLLIQVTSFFRDPALFEALQATVFPRLLEDRPADDTRPIRIWVPGCSTGEEAYSLAIALREFLGGANRRLRLQVFGTDLSEDAITFARTGLYPGKIEADVSPSRIAANFDRTDHHYRVRQELRESCIFARQDLTRDPPFSHLDLVSCRNVLIYLSADLQRRILPIFHYALKPVGFLVLGASETTGPGSDLFETHDAKHRIFTRKSGKHSGFALLLDQDALPRGAVRPWTQPPDPRPPMDLRQEATRLLLEHYVPPGVLVDAQLGVLEFQGQTGLYLEAPPGPASLALMGLVRKGLWTSVERAIETAKKEHREAFVPGARVRDGDRQVEVGVRVLPLDGPEGGAAGFLVLFESDDRPLPPQMTPQERDDELRRTQQELARAREHLQTTIHAFQASNEEVLSSNEELQSTNEELQTAKEEIQSTNEELTTLNEELRIRHSEVSQANDDLNNVLSSANIPLVLIRPDLTIRRITPMAGKVLNLIPSDVGRNLMDIRLNVDLAVEDLVQLIAGVTESLTPLEREVRDTGGCRRLLRIRPYKTMDGRIDGVVLAVIDIEGVRQAADRSQELAREEERLQQLEASRNRLVGMLETISDAFCALDSEGRFLHVNGRAEQLLERSSDSLLGKSMWEELPLLASKSGLRGPFQRALETNQTVSAEVKALDGHVYDARLYPTREGISLYLADVSDRRALQEKAARSEALEQSNAALERFADVIAHDLSEPLRTIGAFAKLLRTRHGAQFLGEPVEFLEFIEEGAVRMDALLRSVLAYSRVGVKVTRQLEESERVVDEVIADLTEKITAAGATVSRGQLPMVWADASLLAQVFQNLIVNAIKFAGDNPPRIDIQARPEAEGWVFSVRDQGIGISPSDIDKVFLLFHRGDSNSSVAGEGLGLAIAQKIVDLHRGRIWAESELGTGTTIHFSLPERPRRGALAREGEVETELFGP